MKQNKFCFIAAAVIVCSALPFTALASEDIPPANYVPPANNLPSPRMYAITPEEEIVLRESAERAMPETDPATTGAENPVLHVAESEIAEDPEGQRVYDIENSPALRSAGSDNISLLTGIESHAAGAENIGSGNAGTGSAPMQIEEGRVPLGNMNDQVNTGRPLSWPPILSAVLMLGAIPFLLKNKQAD